MMFTVLIFLMEVHGLRANDISLKTIEYIIKKGGFYG